MFIDFHFCSTLFPCSFLLIFFVLTTVMWLMMRCMCVCRGIIRSGVIGKMGVKLTTVSKPAPEPPCWHSWAVHEDMQLLKAVQTFQGLPLNLLVVSPGHTVNWDFSADYVNTTSLTYRSPKQCRHR